MIAKGAGHCYCKATLDSSTTSIMDDGTECTFNRFANERKLGGMAGTPDGCAATRRDLDSLEN